MDALLYVADMIRPLRDGKPILVGLHPDKRVVVRVPKGTPLPPTPEKPGALPLLSILVTLRSLPAGMHRVAMALFAPTGTPLPQQMPAHEIAFESEASLNLMLDCTPFVIPAEGTFIVRVELDGARQDLPFEVRVVEGAGAVNP